MPAKIVEAVPNFSEGRDKQKINQIVEAISSVPGTKVLDVNFDPDYNRSVVTVIGELQAIKKAMFNATKKALELIDISSHKGVHPRIGAMDVIPFIPVKGISMQECVELAKELGKEIGEKLQVPVFLYEEAASFPERKNLANIRRGEFEGLKEKISQGEWKPDFGPIDSSKGAVVVGARNFLIAFNVNLESSEQKIAEVIAKRIRELRSEGRFPGVKAIGVFLESRGIAQVSMNVTDHGAISPKQLFEEVKKIAKEFGTNATGFEVVGLKPEQVLKAAEEFT